MVASALRVDDGYACYNCGMSVKSAIEWTDTTWNPVTGCTKVSPGCENCYAERFAERFREVAGHPYEQGFDLRLRPERLLQPISWKRSRMIFVNSMSDLFHKDIPVAFIDRVFDTMEHCDWHVFQVLTKRSSLMRNYLRSRYGAQCAPDHIWCGVSVENNQATVRIGHLQQSPVSTRFLSLEPLIGPVTKIDLTGIHWVIVGGESGPRARPMKLSWATAIRDLCKKTSVPFFFKQWGGFRPKSGGREINGVQYNAIPIWPKGPSNMKFKWTLGGQPPTIEEHSLAKLKVLRSYLREYMMKMFSSLPRDNLKLTLVDGFAGGGQFQHGAEIVSGSPLVMLEEAKAAEADIKLRRIKDIRFDLRYHFVDRNKAHAEYLSQLLKKQGYAVGDNIVVHNKRFGDVATDIVQAAKKHSPRAGRAIFLLDQSGYTHVDFSNISMILDELPNAEVILTLAMDALVNFLRDDEATIKRLKNIGLPQDRLDEWLGKKNEPGGKAIVQREIRNLIRSQIALNKFHLYDTPFIIRPGQSRRALFFMHLCRHPTARNVMVQQHWNTHNTFEHFGPGGLHILEYYSLLSGEPTLFNFKQDEEEKVITMLKLCLPRILHSLAAKHPITVKKIQAKLANDTAATFDQLCRAIVELHGAGEIAILNNKRRKRTRSKPIKLQLDDMVSVEETIVLPFGTTAK